jgi:hypothetical protein
MTTILRRGRTALALVLVALPLVVPGPALAALSSSQRIVLRAYVDALERGRYASAFALLADDERRYYASPANFASVFEADAFHILDYRILGSEATAKGVVAVVSEHVSFRDHAHQTVGSATAKVPYELVSGSRGLAIRDPGHPWRAFAPTAITADGGGLRATVRKVSFFTGRVEFVITFQNHGDSAITILPYGRSVLRDAKGNVYRPIATKLSTLTDARLYTGLRLPGSGQYTGFMTFATPDRFQPESVRLSLAPALADGADAPFALDFAPFVPPSI